MPSTPAGSSRPTRTTSVSTGRSSPGNFETEGGLGGSAPTPPTRHRQRASSTGPWSTPAVCATKSGPGLSDHHPCLVAVLALAAVVGSLYYVGRGAQSKGESRSRLPPDPSRNRSPTARSNAQTSPPPKAREVPKGRSPGKRSGRRSRRPARPAATARDAHRAGQRRRRPVRLSILATASLPTSRSPSQVSPRPSRRSARSA